MPGPCTSITDAPGRGEKEAGPCTLNPGETAGSASAAVWTDRAQVAWPFTLLIPGELDGFMSRWPNGAEMVLRENLTGPRTSPSAPSKAPGGSAESPAPHQHDGEQLLHHYPPRRHGAAGSEESL